MDGANVRKNESQKKVSILQIIHNFVLKIIEGQKQRLELDHMTESKLYHIDKTESASGEHDLQKSHKNLFEMLKVSLKPSI